MSEHSPYLSRLLRLADAMPGFQAQGPPPAGRFAEMEVRLALSEHEWKMLPDWLKELGETALMTTAPEGWIIVSLAGEVIVIPPEVASGEPPALRDLGAEGGQFWAELYRALGSIGMQRPFTAHAHLERARLSLLRLYRMALAPGEISGGWRGVEALPGAQSLDALQEWLVCPLDVREQWRCSHRLAAVYESLTLPLLERLDLPYPWAMRNLVFKRLDLVRPEHRPAEQSPVSPSPAAETKPGPVKVKVRIRRGGQPS